MMCLYFNLKLKNERVRNLHVISFDGLFVGLLYARKLFLYPVLSKQQTGALLQIRVAHGQDYRKFKANYARISAILPSLVRPSLRAFFHSLHFNPRSIFQGNLLQRNFHFLRRRKDCNGLVLRTCR